jgi:glycosyltransferase involved in cell wall biosynthesis
MTKLSRVRILHVTTSFPLDASSISGIFIYRLISHFASEVETIVLTPDSRNSAHSLTGNYRLETFRYALKRWQVLAHEPGGLPAAIKRSRWTILLLPLFFLSMLLHTIRLSRKCDVIHAHWTINGIIAGLAGAVTRTRVVTTLRGEDVNRSHSALIHRCLLFLCFKLSHHIVTVSSSMQKELVDKYPAYGNRVSFIPNGVSEHLFAIPLPRKTLHPRVLVLGSLIPVKSVDCIIFAFSLLDKTLQWNLLIAGIGSEQEKLKAMAQQKGLSEKIEFLGQVPPARVVELLSETDILVQASYREGRPNAVIEAMAAGVAIIGSDIDGISELIKHHENGLLFQAGNVEELLVQLQALLESSSKRRELGRAGRQTLLDKKLTWPKCAASYLEVYQDLLREKMT